MGVILVKSGSGSSSSGSSGHTHANLASLNALSITTNNDLKVNGVLVGEKGVELSYSHDLTAQDVANKYLELPDDCDVTRAITVVLANVSQMRGSDWEVVENASPILDQIVWAGLNMEKLAMVDDSIEITYYRKRV